MLGLIDAEQILLQENQVHHNDMKYFSYTIKWKLCWNEYYIQTLNKGGGGGEKRQLQTHDWDKRRAQQKSNCMTFPENVLRSWHLL